MSNVDKQIILLPFLQRYLYQGNKAFLYCNLIVLPTKNPLQGQFSDTGQISFAHSVFTLNAFIRSGNTTRLPELETYDEMREEIITQNKNREKEFETLGNQFELDDTSDKTLAGLNILVKKYLPHAYLHRMGKTSTTTANAVTDSSYFCAFKNPLPEIAGYQRDDKVSWQKVIAFALNQPLLAKALGILYTDIKIELNKPDALKKGGWLHFDFKNRNETNALDLSQSDVVEYYAAAIPPLSDQSKSLFSPILFPVLRTDAFGNLEEAVPMDEEFMESVIYADGFAKTTHCSQPLDHNPILENKENALPLSDIGIRLGWDDEQVLIWMNRGFQYATQHLDEKKASTRLGVSRYRLDVAEISDTVYVSSDLDLLSQATQGHWKSQVAVQSNTALILDDINFGDFSGEFGIQVCPTQITANNPSEWWLPAYFTFWNGTCLAATDPIPETLNHLTAYKESFEDKNNPSFYTQIAETKIDLKYGKNYAFRIRLSDLSGGGPTSDDQPQSLEKNTIVKHHFTRNVAPQPPDVVTHPEKLTITRPRLSYPAALFAGNFTTDSVLTLLLEDRYSLNEAYEQITFGSDGNNFNDYSHFKYISREPGIFDPDVNKVQIIVEVSTLDMDRESSWNASRRIAPKEPFVFLYKTTREFNNYVLDFSTSSHQLELPIRYLDSPQLFRDQLSEEYTEWMGEGANYHEGALLIPSARKVRLTIQSFCSKDDPNYFGDNDFQYSSPYYVELYKEIEELEEAPLFQLDQESLFAVYYRPEKSIEANDRKRASEKGEPLQLGMHIVERLAALGKLRQKGLSLLGKENTRTLFGCSRKIGHTLSPDHSSLTFSAVNDLSYKWLVFIQIEINRDWCWNMTELETIEIYRQWQYKRGETSDFDDRSSDEEFVGTVGLTRGLNWQDMEAPDRNTTRLLFIDAMDPKPGETPVGIIQEISAFPEPLFVRYRLQPRFKNINIHLDDYTYQSDNQPEVIHLPMVNYPDQVPKIVAMGLASSPFDSEALLFQNKYAETSEQSRYLWVEFEEALQNPDDLYFGRVLAYAPDEIIAQYDDNTQEELAEPKLDIDPEVIRVIHPGQLQDNAGIDAMQPLLPSTAPEKAKHFLIPLPIGLNPDSLELFGFFTYEFRVGHGDHNWSTAQARFGLPIRLTGIQHPKPSLRLAIMRSVDRIQVATSFAQSFYKGKSYNPRLPKTTSYCLLYAQVIQADGKQYRNVLIDTKPFISQAEKNEPMTGLVVFDVKKIRTSLITRGLHIDSPLSVLGIEIMPDERDRTRKVMILDLEKTRILRTSRLYKVENSCPVMS